MKEVRTISWIRYDVMEVCHIWNMRNNNIHQEMLTNMLMIIVSFWSSNNISKVIDA